MNGRIHARRIHGCFSLGCLGALALLLWTTTTTAETTGYWRFEEASGDALDFGSGGNDGTLLGGAARSTTILGSTVPLTGALNTQSMAFDGIDGSVVNMGTNPNVGGSDFTLEAFVRVDSVSGTDVIAGKNLSGNFLDKGYVLTVDPGSAGGTVNFHFNIGENPGSRAFLDSGDLPIGGWYHVAGTRELIDGLSYLTLYVGPAQGTSTVAASTAVMFHDYTSGQDFSIGGSNAGGGGGFINAVDGFVDEVRLSDEVLDPRFFLNYQLPEGTVVAGSTNVVVTDVLGTSFQSESNKLYRLQSTPDLVSTNFTETGAIVVGDGDGMTLFDPAGPSATRNYRVIEE